MFCPRIMLVLIWIKEYWEVVDLFTNEVKMDGTEASKDLLGRTYEYCIAQFAAYEGTKGGEFYTPSSIVKTIMPY